MHDGLLTISVSNQDLGGGIDQVDELWVGISRSHSNSETLKLILKSAVGQDEDPGAHHAIARGEIEVVKIDT